MNGVEKVQTPIENKQEGLREIAKRLSLPQQSDFAEICIRLRDYSNFYYLLLNARDSKTSDLKSDWERLSSSVINAIKNEEIGVSDKGEVNYLVSGETRLPLPLVPVQERIRNDQDAYYCFSSQPVPDDLVNVLLGEKKGDFLRDVVSNATISRVNTPTRSREQAIMAYKYGISLVKNIPYLWGQKVELYASKIKGCLIIKDPEGKYWLLPESERKETLKEEVGLLPNNKNLSYFQTHEITLLIRAIPPPDEGEYGSFRPMGFRDLASVCDDMDREELFKLLTVFSVGGNRINELREKIIRAVYKARKPNSRPFMPVTEIAVNKTEFYELSKDLDAKRVFFLTSKRAKEKVRKKIDALLKYNFKDLNLYTLINQILTFLQPLSASFIIAAQLQDMAEESYLNGLPGWQEATRILKKAAREGNLHSKEAFVLGSALFDLIKASNTPEDNQQIA